MNGSPFNKGASFSGAAYSLVRVRAEWFQEDDIKFSNSGAFDRFGFSIALGSEVLVMGAEGEASIATGVNGDETDNSATFVGAAYVFDGLADGIGSEYCSPAVAHSTGLPGVLAETGSMLMVADNVALDSIQNTPNVFGFFLTSRSRGMVSNPGGSMGSHCLAGSIGRFAGPGQPVNSGFYGSMNLSFHLASLPNPTDTATVDEYGSADRIRGILRATGR